MLYLAGCQLSGQAMPELCQAFHHGAGACLRELWLQGTLITALDIKALVTSVAASGHACRAMRVLSLRWNYHIGSEGIKILAEALKSEGIFPALEVLDLYVLRNAYVAPCPSCAVPLSSSPSL